MKKDNIIKFIKRIIYPPSCVFCRSIIEINSRMNVCGNCSNGIKFASDRICCKKCGKPIVGYNEKQLCYFCINNNKNRFDRIVSVFTYEGLVRDSVIRFKANGYTGYAETYADCLMAKFYEEYSNINFDFICGAPSYDRKARNKEFDPVDLMCKRFSKRVGIKYNKHIFVYSRKTVKQSSLGYEERQKNMYNSLNVLPELDLSGKTVLLIDDVCTTRATINECSRALKAAGAKRVYALTLATVG